MRYESGSPEETGAIAEYLAPHLEAGDVILLRGEVGTGKTAFVKALGAALGVVDTVTSPTYAIAARYEGPRPLAHIDAYRLGDPDAEEIGMLLETIGDDAVAAIEWPESVASALPEPRVEIELTHAGDDRRVLVIRTADDRLADELARIVADARD